MSFKTLILTTLEPPYHQKGMDGKIVFWEFQIPVDAVRLINEDIWQELVLRDAKFAEIVCAHGDDSGNLHSTARAAIERFKPDLVFCCYPNEARRVNLGLPIQGNSDRSLLVTTTPGTRVVRIEEDD